MVMTNSIYLVSSSENEETRMRSETNISLKSATQEYVTPTVFDVEESTGEIE